MDTRFWQGFEKAAESFTPDEDPPMLARSISQAGPRLDTVTEESDRGKHEGYRG